MDQVVAPDFGTPFTNASILDALIRDNASIEPRHPITVIAKRPCANATVLRNDRAAEATSPKQTTLGRRVFPPSRCAEGLLRRGLGIGIDETEEQRLAMTL